MMQLGQRRIVGCAPMSVGYRGLASNGGGAKKGTWWNPETEEFERSRREMIARLAGMKGRAKEFEDIGQRIRLGQGEEQANLRELAEKAAGFEKLKGRSAEELKNDIVRVSEEVKAELAKVQKEHDDLMNDDSTVKHTERITRIATMVILGAIGIIYIAQR